MSSPDIANEMYADFRSNHPLVVFEKHGGALRNSYGENMPDVRPDVVLGATLPWSDDQPEGVFVTDTIDPGHERPAAEVKAECVEAAAAHIIKLGQQPAIYSWFAKDAMGLAQITGAEAIVARDERVCDTIEDKALLAKHLELAGCMNAKTPRHEEFKSARELPSYEETTAHLGLPLVLQGKSMGGDGTKIVTTPAEYYAARQELRGAIRASEFIDTPYSSLYCLALPTPDNQDVETLVDVPSHKPVDIAELGVGNVAGAGGDWRQARPDFDLGPTIAHIQKLASYFYKNYGYHGAFVVEGFVRGQEFLFNEINARPGGGSEVNGAYQVERGLPTFTSLHILGRLGLAKSNIVNAGEYNELSRVRCMQGTETGAFYIKYKNSGEQAVRPSAAYRGSGVYQLEGSELSWRRPEISSLRASFDDGEILVSNGPDAKRGVILANKQICSLEAHGTKPIFDDQELTEHTKMLAKAVSRLFVPV